MKNYNSYIIALKNNRVKCGAKVIACPNHQRECLEGIVVSFSNSSLIVRYGEDLLLELDRATGKLTNYCDSSVDINLIEVDD